MEIARSRPNARFFFILHEAIITPCTVACRCFMRTITRKLILLFICAHLSIFSPFAFLEWSCRTLLVAVFAIRLGADGFLMHEALSGPRDGACSRQGILIRFSIGQGGEMAGLQEWRPLHLCRFRRHGATTGKTISIAISIADGARSVVSPPTMFTIGR